MTRRLALVALWLAATVFAVLLASFAVRLAGDKVVAEGPATVTRGQVEADLTSVPGTTAPSGTLPAAPIDAVTAPADPAPGAGPATTTTSSPGPTVGGAAPRSTDDTVGATGTGSGTGTGTGGAASDPTTTAAVPGGDDGPSPSGPGPVVTTVPPAAEQSFPLIGGIVRMRCVGAAASLVSSSPNPGYAMDVRATGPREVEVRFTGADHTSELKGSCVDGAISADAKESGGGGGGAGSGRDS